MSVSKVTAEDGSFHMIVKQNGYRIHLVLSGQDSLALIHKEGKIILDTLGDARDIIGEAFEALCGVEDEAPGVITREDMEKRDKAIKDMNAWFKAYGI